MVLRALQKRQSNAPRDWLEVHDDFHHEVHDFAQVGLPIEGDGEGSARTDNVFFVLLVVLIPKLLFGVEKLGDLDRLLQVIFTPKAEVSVFQASLDVAFQCAEW